MSLPYKTRVLTTLHKPVELFIYNDHIYDMYTHAHIDTHIDTHTLSRPLGKKSLRARYYYTALYSDKHVSREMTAPPLFLPDHN